MVCDDCTKNKSVQVCGSCREITKCDLMLMTLGLYESPKAILLESQRNKTGSRSCKKVPISCFEKDIKWYRENKHWSYRKIAEYLGISVGSVYNVLNNKQ